MMNTRPPNRRHATRFAVVGLATVALATLGNIGTARADVVPGGSTTGVLSGAAQEFLAQRAAALLDTPATASPKVLGHEVALSPGLAGAESAATSELHARRDRLRAVGEAYTSATTELSDAKTAQRGDTTVLSVTETTTLEYKKIRGDEPANTAYSAPREFTFERTATGWTLTGQRLVEPDAVPPVTEPAGQPKVDLSITDPTAAAPGSPATTGPVSKDPAPAGEIRPFYNYSAMAAYAERYWRNYNSAYRTFNDRGGDCTNFISQALRAGGWADAPGFYRDYHYWWYNRFNQTYSWVNVNSWASFALSSGRTHNLRYLTELGLGDILQVDFDRASGKDHSMIVSYVSGGTAYLTYHTTNTYRRSVWSIYNSNPNALYYAFRT